MAGTAKAADSDKRIMIYGATGHVGRRVAAEAARCGLDAVLAGRDPAELEAVADPLGFPCEAFVLSDAAGLERVLSDVALVLHVAGPFTETAEPMVAACLATGTHYLDLTNEIDVFESLARLDAEAEQAGITLLPGVGFEVVPSDCLAVHTAGRIEEPTRMRMAIAGANRSASEGSAKSAIERLGSGLRVREDGIIRDRPSGRVERYFDFGAGPARAFAMPSGAVATTFYSTGVPNIEIYVPMSGPTSRFVKASRLARTAPGHRFVERFLQSRAKSMPDATPEENLRHPTRAVLLAEVEGPGDQLARSMLETPSGDVLTPIVAIETARRVLEGDKPVGFQTPASAIGADFILDIPNCRRHDLD